MLATEFEVSCKYQDLIAWQKAKAFATAIYSATESFPKTEIYGLTSQLRRAAVSVASNIAEGQGRLTKGEFCHFLGQARGSLLELETQLSVAVDLRFLSEDDFGKLQKNSVEVRKLLNGLIESLLVRKAASNSKLET
ncbi:MAG TPA: four helix bundle protein [Candidatus Sulfotelmatobacter sp.]|nr:four helix bundle protein [Candidatus Sulfotelmatobacter sp.]